MFNSAVSSAFREFSGVPSFRIYGRARREPSWHVLDVYATHRRDLGSRWPLFRGTCITWTASVIAVGWDFAAEVYREQVSDPASRERPVEVVAGTLRDVFRRDAVGGPPFPSMSEVLAHECGHTGQARRMGVLYWPLAAPVTLFREGPHFYNHFENQASREGQFGGFVKGSVSAELLARVRDGAS